MENDRGSLSILHCFNLVNADCGQGSQQNIEFPLELLRRKPRPKLFVRIQFNKSKFKTNNQNYLKVTAMSIIEIAQKRAYR